MGSKLRLVLVQFAPSSGRREENLHVCERLVGDKRGDIFVFPQLFSTAAGIEESARLSEKTDGPTPAFMKALAVKKKAYVLGSYLARPQKATKSKARQGPPKPFIRSLAIAPDGNVIGIYDAVHLCSIEGEPAHRSAGKKMPFFDLLTFRSGLIGSYDLRFPEIAREFALSNGFLLFVLGAYPRSQARAWETLLAARACENQMFSIGCNFGATSEQQKDGSSDCFAGGSAVFAPDGRKLHQAGPGEQVLILDVDPFEVEWNRMRHQFITDAQSAPVRKRKRVHESPLDKA